MAVGLALEAADAMLLTLLGLATAEVRVTPRPRETLELGIGRGETLIVVLVEGPTEVEVPEAGAGVGAVMVGLKVGVTSQVVCPMDTIVVVVWPGHETAAEQDVIVIVLVA